MGTFIFDALSPAPGGPIETFLIGWAGPAAISAKPREHTVSRSERTPAGDGTLRDAEDETRVEAW
jgi:hypothetical protein